MFSKMLILYLYLLKKKNINDNQTEISYGKFTISVIWFNIAFKL